MLKKLSVVFIMLLIFIVAVSAAYAKPEEGNTGTSSKTTVNAPSGTSATSNAAAALPANSIVAPSNIPVSLPSNNSTQKDGGSQTGSNVAFKTTGTGETKTNAASAEKETSGGTEKDKEQKEDPDAAFWRAIRKVLEAGKPVSNGQSVVTIKKPENIEGDVTTYGKTFEISFESEYTDVEILIAMLSSESGMYEIIELPDGDRVLNIGSGALSTELELDPGEYDLLLIAYRTSEKDPEHIQYTPIAVTVFKDSWWAQLKKTGKQIIDWFGSK